MTLYAESSAVLAWLLTECPGEAVREALERAEIVFASDLTLIECDRMLIRAAHLGEISEASAADRRARLNLAAAHWALLPMSDDVVIRARRPFPEEPLRTLDALHLASALVARQAAPDLALLALDERVRRCGRALGFDLAPAA